MLGLLFFFLLLIAGTFLAYRFSSASKVKKRMQEVLSPFEELDAESRRLRQALESDIELASSQYIQRVNADRLKAIPLNDVKKHATGIRLQALKDFGIRSVADLQGWNEYRISQVRGVGPKSVSAIVHAVARITTATRVIPIDHPTPPFLGDTARQLIQALYRQHWFDMHIAEQNDAFAKILALHQSARNEVLTKINFGCWLWKFGSNKTIRQNINRANATVGALEEESSRSMRDKLSNSLSEGRAVCTNRVSVDSIIQDFNENRELYDSWLTSRLGKSVSTVPAKPMSQQAGPNTAVASDLVHVEFGRVVPGPPRLPIGENHTVSLLPETHPRHPEGLVSVSVGSNIAQQPTEFALPIAQRAARSKDVRWLSKGESIQLQGHTLPHGLVYVGEGSHSERHYVLDPSPSAKPESHYSFSYPTLSPEQRSQYLAWLAEGASLSTDAGFGMLYFYGLERRILDLIQGKSPILSRKNWSTFLKKCIGLEISFRANPGA